MSKRLVGIPEDQAASLMSSTSQPAILQAFGDDGPIVEIMMSHEHPEAILCFDQFQRGFVCLSDEARQFARPGDEDALPAINRMWNHQPHKFREVKRRTIIMPELEDEGPGLIADLTDRDRERLRKIIRKHHKRYFADHPTDAQCDNLIEGIGLKVAQKIVKQNLDAGDID